MRYGTLSAKDVGLQEDERRIAPWRGGSVAAGPPLIYGADWRGCAGVTSTLAALPLEHPPKVAVLLAADCAADSAMARRKRKGVSYPGEGTADNLPKGR